MAVTQLLVRLTQVQLDRCRDDEHELDRLISFDLAPAEDCLDLDWAPAPLGRLLALVDCPELAATVSLACNGDQIVNPRFPSGPHNYPVYSEVRCLMPARVAEVSRQLKDIAPDGVFAVLPACREDANRALALEGLLVHPSDYLGHHLRNLTQFYADAAAQNLAVPMWND